jgi:2-oxoglutarate ferredoxin oxidoreductase subunit beta
MVELKDLEAGTRVSPKPNWCPGCGNYGILTALKSIIVELQIEPANIVNSSGIGCSGKVPHWIRVYGLHGIHGRALPVATGIKLANHKLTVIAEGGDGDGYGIGACHFVHAMRRNLDITYIVHNNKVYGLTTGQTSPTSDKGFVTKSTPFGVIEPALNPIAVALSTDATFVARGFAGDLKHLKQLLKQGIQHKGFALIDIFQPCVSFNHVNTYQWYKQRIYNLQEEGHDASDKQQAFARAMEWGERIPLGVFYQEQRPTYEDELPQIQTQTLLEQDITNIDITELMEDYK